MKIHSGRIDSAKIAFSARRVPKRDMQGLLCGNLRPEPGDLVLARVDEILKHTKLELTDGRKAHMFPGDEIVVAYGNRYAPDQYEALISEDLSPCDLVAAGGMASVEISRHQRMLPPTRISPVGLIARADGSRLNLWDYRIEADTGRPPIAAVLSLGTSMNAGKTLTAMSMVRGFKRLGHKVAALKITGTGAGGDMWIVRDAGADVVADFTDAGFASTYLTPIGDIETGCARLMNHAAHVGCDIAVIEIADGLQQIETSQLIHSRPILDVTLGTVFAAYDAMGAKYGADLLREAGHNVLAMSGRLGRSPLGVREAEAATGLRVYSPWELQEGMLVPIVRDCAATALAASGNAAAHLRSLARDIQVETPAPGAVATAQRTGNIMRMMQPATRADQARAVLRRVLETVMSAEVDSLCGTSFGLRGPERVNRRNGFRRRRVDTCLGAMDLAVPRLRRGSYTPDPKLHSARREDILAILEAVGSPEFDLALTRLVDSVRAEHVILSDQMALRSGVLSAIRDAALAAVPAPPPPPVPVIHLPDDAELVEDGDAVDADAIEEIRGFGHLSEPAASLPLERGVAQNGPVRYVSIGG